jgi:hypothetical protein
MNALAKLSFMTKSSSAPGIFLFFLPFLKLIYCIRTFNYFAPVVIAALAEEEGEEQEKRKKDN